MATLIEISQDLLAFKSLIDECDTDITPQIEAAMDAWFAELDVLRTDKLDNYAALIREMTLRAAARREEKERLDKRIRVDENTVARLKERLKMFFEMQGLRTVETRRYKLTLCNNGGVTPLNVEADADKLPEEFQRWEVYPDTAKLRKALEGGVKVDGVQLMERGKHLRIS